MTASHTDLPLATVHGLFHIAIKTDDLAATRKFWTEIIGLRDFRPPDFGYPGAWLGCTSRADRHHPCLSRRSGPQTDRQAEAGTAAIDHVSLSCSGFSLLRRSFPGERVDWRGFHVPHLALAAVRYDPSGVQLGINLRGRRRG